MIYIIHLLFIFINSMMIYDFMFTCLYDLIFERWDMIWMMVFISSSGIQLSLAESRASSSRRWARWWRPVVAINPLSRLGWQRLFAPVCQKAGEKPAMPWLAKSRIFAPYPGTGLNGTRTAISQHWVSNVSERSASLLIPQRDLLRLYKQTSSSSKQVPIHFPLLSAKARASVARLILTGLAMQAKQKGTRSLRTLARSCSMTPWHGIPPKGKPSQIELCDFLWHFAPEENKIPLGSTPHPGCNPHHQDLYIIRGTKPTSVTGILGLGHVIQRLPRLPYWTAGKNGPAQNIWILLKNRSFWVKSLLEFLPGVGDCPRKNSVDRPLIPRQIMGTERNTSGVPFASCFFFQKNMVEAGWTAEPGWTSDFPWHVL